MATRVGVVGAAGRMGTAVCAAVANASGLELVAAVDTQRVGQQLEDFVQRSGAPLTIGAGLDTLVEASTEVVVDFTVKEAAIETLEFCAEHAIHAVCGTTGIDAPTLQRLAAAFAGDDRPNCVIAPNFAISAVLMMRFAELAAPLFDGVEIIELHHDQKRDAPSGTALETARRIAAARAGASARDFAPDPTELIVLEGARGAVDDGGIHLHSVRLAGLLAHQEIIFGAAGQALTIRQDSFDRSSFMAGVLLAVEKVATLAGLTVGLDAVLGI